MDVTDAKVLLIFYAFADLRPRANAILKVVQQLADRMSNLTQWLVRYHVRGERKSGWRRLSTGLVSDLYGYAQSNRLQQIDAASGGRNPGVKLLSYLEYRYGPTWVAVWLTDDAMRALTVDGLLEVGVGLVDGLGALYGCALTGIRAESLLEVALGIVSNTLTTEEVAASTVWAKNSRYAARLLRDIYWLNFIRRSHQGPYEDLPSLHESGEIAHYRYTEIGAAFAVTPTVEEFASPEGQTRVACLRQRWQEWLMPEEELPVLEDPNAGT